MLRVTEILRPANRVIDTLVHPDAAGDRREFERHRAFILANLAGGIAALVLLPLTLALFGPITLPVTLALAWLIAQIPVAMFLSRSGSIATAHLASALLFAAFIGAMAALTGGIESFALLWLAIAPLEAALSGSRKVIGIVAGVSAGIVAGLAMIDPAGLPRFAFPGTEISQAALEAVAGAAALAYAGVLALRIDWDNRRGRMLLHEREAKYWLVAENVTDVISLHTADGAVQFVSPSVQSVVGVARREVMGKGLFSRVHVADRPAFLKAISDAARSGERARIEFRVRRGSPASADGHCEYLWLEMNARSVDRAVPGVEGDVVAVCRDISDRKANEAMLAEAREEAEAASAAKTRFLANVSHELRTPLNAIIGFSDLLRNSPHLMQNAEKSGEYIDLIHDSGRHLLQVVNDILDMSKIETGNFDLVVEPFDLPETMEACVRMMRGEADRKEIELVSDVPKSLQEFSADKRACKQILLNLLSNAVKFSDAGSTVVVTARRERDHLVMRVRDRGIGIARDDLERLGMPFFQANSGYDRAHEGTGLGLSVVKGLAELHGGAVEFDSRLGKGTTVSVRLPWYEAEDEAATPGERPAPARKIA
ncbi:PAS domain-containing sensor histidine kinase [Rhizobiales bacterium]|uniref:sensor histidine kinase n=1 Tax=Hongsoonwoonella zoysiae TaxID=2821844 RepID=UPI00155F7070|nr:PAS domain-containing sensor histidine kinase [Hongsoonwoonella zoysiae]NRG19415.1 PAS domain-containing sensor histidine kinase [Hongsoonwoonella zoysiae]